MSAPAAYGLVIAIWATTPLGIQWSSETMSPITSVTLRMLLSLLIAIPLTYAFGVRGMAWNKNWKLYLASAFGICPAMPLVYLGAQYIPSGLVSVLFGLSPFLVGLMSTYVLGDRSMSAGRYLALTVALSGLSVIFLSGETLGPEAILGIVLLLGAVMVFALSSVLVKHYSSNVHPMQQLTGSLALSSLGLVVFWLVLDRSVPGEFTARSFGSLIYLATAGSVLGFIAYFYLIQRLSVNLVTLITLITPVLALWLGYAINNEPLTVQLVIGSALIVLGLALFNRFKPNRKPFAVEVDLGNSDSAEQSR